ncbi:glycosyltransferase family 59 protein [Parathielavia appendiculata]|uniref:Dol-P-Glc:Glc(2)Man(9)GlcNAc(2)-PP-Dol alpha-1,2-glucosyltransferase n=1 Tax=Parathielavia appendiculata TaxID=2587402 RepID=A0AAN6U3Y7_9PEZI|nr:glycosyltransferase family 59 protein [Parathielavia appendiculata]
MERIQAIRQELTAAEVVKGLAVALVLSHFLAPWTYTKSTPTQVSPSSTVWAQAFKAGSFFSLFLAARSWLALVNTYVPEPYLDEVFHIPQAQAYCEGRFWDWDDKITTPPGLYLLSVAYHKLLMLAKCTTSSLRHNNLLATLVTALLASQCRQLIEHRTAEREGKEGSGNLSFYSYHTGVNIALFPVIFFFSALYYTDVVSTVVVLAAYRNHLLRLAPQPPSAANDFWTVILGVSALFMRQTNVFWVVVYMGGLEAVHVLRSAKLAAQGSLAKVHDPILRQSGLEDWLFCALTIAVAALRNPCRILRQIWPHITILALFAGFVAWNGGVVLGDKSNHIATIHLAQMLYVWPLFAFFSAPLLIPSFISALTRPIRCLRRLLSVQTRRAALFSLPYTFFTTLVSFAVVKYNTIIHPFTLADNRHYMFYIFRYTILRSPTIRLALVPAHTLCRWLMWDQLAGTSHATNPPTPSAPTTKPPTVRDDTNQHPVAPATTTAGSLAFLDEDPASSTSPPTSTALLWLLTTALSLVTAPLVEPRYFILPWVFYRLLLPSWSVSDSIGDATPATSGAGRSPAAAAWLWKVGRRIDVRLVLETSWFLVLNAGTMYMFLSRPFYWRDGEGRLLDGGRVQRFMW